MRRTLALLGLALLGGACSSPPGTPVTARPAAGAAERLVRLHLRGLAGADYTLQIEHECGRELRAAGRSDGEHELLLPPGPCIATLRRVREGRQEQFEHAFTVTDGAEQHATWDIAGTLGRALGR